MSSTQVGLIEGNCSAMAGQGLNENFMKKLKGKRFCQYKITR
jgi:hypothetical protein